MIRDYNLIIVIFITIFSLSTGSASNAEGFHGIYTSEDWEDAKISILADLHYPSLLAQISEGDECAGWKSGPDDLCYNIPLGEPVSLKGVIKKPCSPAFPREDPRTCTNLDEVTEGYKPAPNVPVKIEVKNENNGMIKSGEVRTDSNGKFTFSFSNSFKEEESGNWAIKVETYVDDYWGEAEADIHADISVIIPNIVFTDLDSDISKYESLSRGDPANTEYLTVLGWDYLLKGDYAKGKDYFKKVLAIDPASKAAQSGLDQAEAHALNDNEIAASTGQGNPQSQEETAGKGVNEGTSNQATGTASSKSGTYIQNAIAWTGKGDALKKLEKYEEAVEAYNEAIKINPQYAEAWRGKGGSLFNIKKYDESVEAYDEAIRINPQYSQAWNGKGSSLFEQGKYDDAVKAFDEAIRIDPQYALAWYNKGVYLALHLGNYEQAIECYKRAVEIDPSFKYAWENLADALKYLHRDAEAEEALSKARELT